ncbi:hypothetical protein H5410_028032 [Solanum commersonii]|uniref:Uncharacterized protein n=1 Tax=Solanum commersonii TaxID=4109 RepID=A0A9J5Z533_SOLCO|nr:hypothetical protein H5410_028032 [Solanum commersonii]
MDVVGVLPYSTRVSARDRDRSPLSGMDLKGEAQGLVRSLATSIPRYSMLGCPSSFEGTPLVGAVLCAVGAPQSRVGLIDPTGNGGERLCHQYNSDKTLRPMEVASNVPRGSDVLGLMLLKLGLGKQLL